MRPHLILDLRERSLAALVLTEEGRVLPCSHEVGRVSTRYFPAEILFDPQASERSDFPWKALEEDLATAGPNLLSRARRLGLSRPGEPARGTVEIPLRPPLLVLSSPAALAEEGQARELTAAAGALTEALLEPVFRSLAAWEIPPQELSAVVAVPSQLGARAGLVLQKLLRARGFRRVTLLAREVAAAMLLAGSGEPSCLILDLEEESLRLHRVDVEEGEGGLSYRTMGSRTLRGLGWASLVGRLTAALGAAGKIPPGETVGPRDFDRALLGLLGGPYPREIGGRVQLAVTHSLMDELFAGDLAAEIGDAFEKALRPALRELEALGLPLILLGAGCSLGPLADLLLAAAGGSQPAAAARVPALERAIRGVAAALQLRSGRSRPPIEVRREGGLRLDTLRGECIEVLAGDALPMHVGERRRVRRVFELAGDLEAAGDLVVNLVWGCDPDPSGNASLCAFPLESGAGSGDGPHTLRLSLDLACAGNGGRLTGSTLAVLGDCSASRRLHFGAMRQRFSLACE